MAVYLANTADGGSNGTTVTTGNSGGTSGPAWDTVSIGAGATLAYDTTHVLGGHPLSGKIATAASATVFTAWAASLTATSLTQVFYREYLYFTGNPASNVRVLNMLTPGSAQCGGINVTTAGVLACVVASGAAATSTVTTIPLNAWFRIEGYLIGDPSVGQVQVRLFTTADASIPAETKTSTAAQNTTGAVGICRFGICTALASAGPFWLASPGASDTSYLGPEAPAGGLPAVMPSPIYLNRVRPLNPYPRAWKVSGPQQLATTLPAVVTTTAAVQDQVAKTLPAAVTTSSALSRAASRTLAVTVTTAGSLARALSRAFGVTVTTAAAWITRRPKPRITVTPGIAAVVTITPEGNLTARVVAASRTGSGGSVTWEPPAS